MADLVEIILALRGVSAFVADADRAAASMGKVGVASKEAGAAGMSGGKMLKYGMLAAGAGIYGAVKLADSATHAVGDLAKSSLQLHRVTGMSIPTASEYSSLLEERGVSITQAQVGFVTLSKQMEKARLGDKLGAASIAKYRSEIDQLNATGGPKAASGIASLESKIASLQKTSGKATATFAQLGISRDELTKGNTEQVLLKVSDALMQNHDAASRLVAVQTLFGRTGRNLLPVLLQGSAGIHKLLDEQKASGNYLSGKGFAATHNLILEQRALDRQWAGLKVQLGQSLLPVLLLFVKGLQFLARILQPLSKHGMALAIVIGGITTALIAAKIATIAQAVAAGENTVATALWTAAEWLLSASLWATLIPIALIVLGIGLLVLAGYELVKHWGAVERFVRWVWHEIVAGAMWVLGWLRKNWPLVLAILGGPIGIAAYEIVKHWQTIKDFVLGVVHSIEHAFERLIGWAKSIPSKIGGLLHKIPGFGLISGVAGGIMGAFAAGGTASSSGPYLVGEQGPEIVHLPRSAVVAPINLPQLAAATGHGSSPMQLTIPLIVDGRELARAVASVTSNQLARR